MEQAVNIGIIDFITIHSYKKQHVKNKIILENRNPTCSTTYFIICKGVKIGDIRFLLFLNFLKISKSFISI